METWRHGREPGESRAEASRSRAPRWGTTVACLAWPGLALTALVGLPPAPLSAQVPERENSIRVVELFDPATGERARRVAHDLGPTEIRRLEAALAEEGYLTGAPDGVLDPPTRETLRRFQRDRSLAVCGCPSYETVLALGLSPVVTHTLVGPFEDVSTPEVEVIRPSPPEPGGTARSGARRGGEEEPAPPPWTQAFDPEQLEVLRAAFPGVFHAGFRHREFPFPIFFPFHVSPGGEFLDHRHAGHASDRPDAADRRGNRIPLPGIRPAPPARPSPPRNP